MNVRNWMFAATLSLALLASCGKNLTPDSKREAQDRWNLVRARMKCQIAAESFASGQLDQADKHLREAIDLEPTLPEAQVLRARILLERGETASAADALAEASRHGADSPETDYLNGMIAQRYGDFGNALAWYERAAKREAKNAHYLASVAETLVALGRAADALALVRERWTDFEQNATLRALAGGIYMMLDRYEEAADAYRDAARIASDDPVLKYQLGIALTLSGNYREAEGVLSAAVNGSKDVPPSALVALGRCRLATRNADGAKTVLLKATEADPDNGRAWALLAQAALECNDHITARRTATRAVQAAPDCQEYKLLLAWACCCQHDYDSAATILEDILRTAPNDKLAAQMLARCREAAPHTKAGPVRPSFDTGERMAVAR